LRAQLFRLGSHGLASPFECNAGIRGAALEPTDSRPRGERSDPFSTTDGHVNLPLREGVRDHLNQSNSLPEEAFQVVDVEEGDTVWYLSSGSVPPSEISFGYSTHIEGLY